MFIYLELLPTDPASTHQLYARPSCMGSPWTYAASSHIGGVVVEVEPGLGVLAGVTALSEGRDALAGPSFWPLVPPSVFVVSIVRRHSMGYIFTAVLLRFQISYVLVGLSDLSPSMGRRRRRRRSRTL